MSHIFVEITDAQILLPIEHARAHLAAEATAGKGSEYIASALNGLAEAEGAAEINVGFRDMLRAGKSRQEAFEAVAMRHMLNSPDDTWSGRRNDVRRAKQDGRRDRLNNLRFEI